MTLVDLCEFARILGREECGWLNVYHEHCCLAERTFSNLMSLLMFLFTENTVDCACPGLA